MKCRIQTPPFASAFGDTDGQVRIKSFDRCGPSKRPASINPYEPSRRIDQGCTLYGRTYVRTYETAKFELNHLIEAGQAKGPPRSNGKSIKAVRRTAKFELNHLIDAGRAKGPRRSNGKSIKAVRTLDNAVATNVR